MRTLIIILVILLTPIGAYPQNTSVNSLAFTPYFVSTLPPASTNSGRIFQVTDGLTTIDCTSGSGSTTVLCASNGLTYLPVFVGGAAHSISFQFGTPGGAALSTGVLGYATVPFPCTIVGWDIEVDAGTATVKTLKIASGTSIPTPGSNSISTSGVSIATGTVIQSTTLSDFTTTSVVKNDIIAADLIAVSGVGYINFQVNCTQ